MFALLFLAGVAFAQDPKATTTDPTLPTEEGIISVPSGSTVDRPDKPKFSVIRQSYLLPEPHYDRCLTAAENLPICKQGLTQCHELSSTALGQAKSALDLCQGQFDDDAELINELTLKIATLESKGVALEEQRQNLRAQRNTAWAITGGLVLGSITVTAIALGN